jgi:Uri superfamily endonuclease
MPSPAARATSAANPPALPAGGGTYALLLTCRQTADLGIGRIGRLRTRSGVYLYVGSAHGPGGLRARIGHHCRISLSPRWHIDYLRAAATPVQAWFTCDPLPREHQWADVFNRTRGASRPLERFGASDCRCPAHLFFFAQPPDFAAFARKIRRRFPSHAPIAHAALCTAAAGRNDSS